MLKMLPICYKTDNLGLFDIYKNLKMFLDSIGNYDEEIKNIFRGDVSYNLALIEKLSQLRMKFNFGDLSIGNTDKIYKTLNNKIIGR